MTGVRPILQTQQPLPPDSDSTDYTDASDRSDSPELDLNDPVEEMMANLELTSTSAKPLRPGRHRFDVTPSEPLRLTADFVPLKSCREYVKEDCAQALRRIRPHVPALIRAAQKVTPARHTRASLTSAPATMRGSVSVEDRRTFFAGLRVFRLKRDPWS